MHREELLCQARMKLAEVTDLLRDAEEHELAAVAFELLSEVCVSSSWFTRSLGPVNQLRGSGKRATSSRNDRRTKGLESSRKRSAP